MGASWTTPPQAAYLMSRFPQFLDAQGTTISQREKMRVFQAENREYFFARWSPAVEAQEFEEADKKADEDEKAAMMAAGRTKPTAAEKQKRKSREREKKGRLVFATQELWLTTRTEVRAPSN